VTVKALPSDAERYIRKILAALLLVTALPAAAYFLVATTGLTLPSTLTLVVIFGAYTLRSQGYHLKTDLFFALVGLVSYTLPVPIFVLGFMPVAPLPLLKGSVTLADWGREGVGISTDIMPLYLLLSAINILFLISALFMLAANLLFRVKPVTSSKRSLFLCLVFLAILSTVAAMPWLHVVTPAVGGATGAYGPGPGSGVMLGFSHVNTTVAYDHARGLWVYQLGLINTNAMGVEIVAVMGKVGSETVQVAPPFGEGVEVVGGERTPSGVIIWPTVSGRPEPGEPPVNKPALSGFTRRTRCCLLHGSRRAAKWVGRYRSGDRYWT